MSDTHYTPTSALLGAWLAQSHDLLALSDARGRLRWCNAAFERATGLAAGAEMPELADSTGDAELELRTAAGASLWVSARVTRVDDDWLWTLQDVTERRTQAARAQHLSELLDIAQEFGRLGVWERDIPSGSGRWDRHVFEFWGLDPSDGTPPYAEAAARLHPDDQSNAYVESIRQAGRYAQRYRVVRSDGTWRWIYSQWEVKNSAQGVPDRAIGIMVDDTQVYELARSRDAAEGQLKIATELAQAAATAARIGIWTTVIGTEETDWNAQMYELFGIDERERAPTLGEWLRRCVHPDDAERVAQVSIAYLHGETHNFELEFRVRTANGETRWMVLRADRSQSGDPKRIYGIAMDVTDRHAAQTELQTASERAALIARHAGIGTWETDERGSDVRWDDQMFRLRGLAPRAVPLDREERLGLVHPDDRAYMLDATPQRHAALQNTAYEFRVRWPDGQYRWLASRSTPLFDAAGQMVRRVGVNWDITDHKNAELARQQALLAERESQAKSRFLARMSHELRTPLNAVLGFTQLLQLEARQHRDAERLTKLNLINNAGKHLLELVNDALDLSSLEAGTLKLELQPVVLALAVGRARSLVDRSAAAPRVTISVGRLDGTALADSNRLEQVLLNLLSNAIKYNRVGGEVGIESSVEAGHVRLRVRDTGRGMTPEQLAQLFEPFNRISPEHESAEGSGIGMTIARALIEGMNGRIEAHSGPGQGTVFDVTLPRVDSATATPLRAQEASDTTLLPDLAPGTRSAQVLYIEDNSVNVLLVESLLAQLPGVRIYSEATGTDGVARAHELRPDLILIDMQLPDFDGIEVIRQLRAQRTTAAIPCIALSANAMPEDIARARAAGFDDYWTKPIRFREFLAAMAQRFPLLPASAD